MARRSCGRLIQQIRRHALDLELAPARLRLPTGILISARCSCRHGFLQAQRSSSCSFIGIGDIHITIAPLIFCTLARRHPGCPLPPTALAGQFHRIACADFALEGHRLLGQVVGECEGGTGTVRTVRPR